MLRQHRLLYHDYFVHAIYHLTVVDGHTGKVVARTSSPIWGSEEVDETYWPFDSDNIAVDQARRVADLAKKAINDSMPDGLKSLNLLRSRRQIAATAPAARKIPPRFPTAGEFPETQIFAGLTPWRGPSLGAWP